MAFFINIFGEFDSPISDQMSKSCEFYLYKKITTYFIENPTFGERFFIWCHPQGENLHIWMHCSVPGLLTHWAPKFRTWVEIWSGLCGSRALSTAGLTCTITPPVITRLCCGSGAGGFSIDVNWGSFCSEPGLCLGVNLGMVKQYRQKV